MVSRALAHVNHFLGIVLVRALGPDRLSFPEMKAKAGSSDRDVLPRRRAQMHLDTAFGFIVPDHMLEARQIEITIEFAIDTSEKVFVERGRNTGRVVIGEPQHWNGLFQIRREQKRIVFLQDRSDFPQELISRGPVEIPDRAAEEEDQ